MAVSEEECSSVKSRSSSSACSSNTQYLAKCVLRGSIVLQVLYGHIRSPTSLDIVFGKETSIELVIIGEDGIVQSVCEQPVFGTIKDITILPWNEKFHVQNPQMLGKDLVVVISDSGKLSFLTFCNEMHRFFPLTHVQLSNPGNSRNQLGRMLAIDSSGCFIAASAYEDRLALFSVSMYNGNDVIDERISYPPENEGDASIARSIQKNSIRGTIWSMCFISQDSSQPSKGHNAVLAILLNRRGAVTNELLILGWNITESTICVISEYSEAGPLAHNIVEVPHSNGFAFLFRDGDALLLDLRDPHNPCCLYRTSLNFLPNAVDEHNFVEESCRVHDVDDEGLFNVAACALLELRDYDPMCIDGENGNVTPAYKHVCSWSWEPEHHKIPRMIFCVDTGEFFMIEIFFDHDGLKVNLSECLYKGVPCKALLWVQGGYLITLMEMGDGMVLTLENGRLQDTSTIQNIAPILDMSVTDYHDEKHDQMFACCGVAPEGEFPLSANPSIVLHVLTACNLDPQDLAKLEATCSFFRQPANFAPDFELSLSELAALDMCQKRAIFRPMTTEERQELKQRCGGSWKLVLRFLLAGEACTRREKSHAIAGPGHSIAVTSRGLVYSFGSNSSGQLGNGTTEEEWQPQPIRSLQGIRIIQAAAGAGKTMLISDAGRVYAFGKDSFGEAEYGVQGAKLVTTPQLVESLKNIFVVQAAIGNFFTAILSREGRVYTFSWGNDVKLGHQTDPTDMEPHPLLGALENIPVVQIAAGYCYLLALACQPSGMSVYSVGCGLGGKLGHGARTDEKHPRIIEQFQLLNLQPMVVAAGAWHAAVVGRDGRVCTWGWGRYGCLGHGNEECESVPKVVEALSNVKAVHVATGDYTTFVVSDDGDVYSFGCGESSSLGHNAGADGQGNRHANVLSPELVTSLKQVNERVVQISLTNSIYWNAHTFALTESGKLYAFGAGDKGQLGVELVANQTERGNPELVDIDLN